MNEIKKLTGINGFLLLQPVLESMGVSLDALTIDQMVVIMVDFNNIVEKVMNERNKK